MSWKMMLVLATLAIPAAACKTVSHDNQPATPASAQEKATEPAAQEKAEPAQTDPAKTDEAKSDEAKKSEEGKSEESSDSSKEAQPKSE